MNNKGFTMVELLVSMAIMGLLIIMAFPTIRAIQTNNNKTKYEEYGKTVLSASKLYTDSYEEDLFDLNETNAMKSIDLNELVKKDLLKDISVSDTTCLNGSSVNIIKYKDDYTYCLNLLCTVGGKEVYSKISKEGKCKDLTIYTVAYSSPGQADYVVSVVDGEKHTVLSPEAAHISIPKGKKFVQWNESGIIGSKKPGNIITVDSNVRFTPQFDALNYKVRYKSSISGASGSMPDQNCTVGKSCKLLPNKFIKDYYTFDNYKYNGKTYKVDSDMKNVFNITKDNQIVEVNATFRKNLLTLNYNSNGGVLTPGRNQKCPALAGCKKSECIWPQLRGCKNKSGLIYQGKDNFDVLYNANYSSAGIRDYRSSGSLYLTKTGCSSTDNWLVGSNNSSKKINSLKKYTSGTDFFKEAGIDDTIKKGDATLNLYAEWKCPTYTLTIKKDDNINSVKMDGVNTTSKKVKYGTTVKVEVGAKDYYHAKWADNNSTATSRSVKVTKDMTLTVKSVKNQLVINQYSAGGKLTPGNRQLCRKLAGCGNNECLDNPEANNSNEVAKCKNASGLIYVGSPDTYDTTVYNKDGLRDYATKSGATLYLTRTNCTATKYWHVGSEYSSTKIHEDNKYKNAAEFVKACGASYSNDFKKKNISINLYAGWDCPNEIKCSAGKYLPKNKTSCAVCTAGKYCPGGTFKKNTSKDQGINACPSGYGNSAAGSKKIEDCYIIVSAGKYIKTKKKADQTPCGNGTYKAKHNVNYGSVSSCSNCPNGYRDGNGTTAQSNCIKKVAAGHYLKTAKDTAIKKCSAGYYRVAHSVKYGNKSACGKCPNGYGNSAEGSTAAKYCYRKNTATFSYLRGAESWNNSDDKIVTKSCKQYYPAESCQVTAPNHKDIPGQSHCGRKYNTLIINKGWNTDSTAKKGGKSTGTKINLSSNITYYSVYLPNSNYLNKNTALKVDGADNSHLSIGGTTDGVTCGKGSPNVYNRNQPKEDGYNTLHSYTLENAYIYWSGTWLVNTEDRPYDENYLYIVGKPINSNGKNAKENHVCKQRRSITDPYNVYADCPSAAYIKAQQLDW